MDCIAGYFDTDIVYIRSIDRSSQLRMKTKINILLRLTSNLWGWRQTRERRDGLKDTAGHGSRGRMEYTAILKERSLERN